MFSNIPLQEDTVEYRIYTKGQCNLDQLVQQAQTFQHYLVQNFIKDFIWQDDSFLLEPSLSPVPHLSGTTQFGDNINDEWFIVYLLWQLTKKFPDIYVQVSDSDGQFLLIEAALEIPRWLNTENSENRVWISNGKFHIIPKPRNEQERSLLPHSTVVSLAEGLKIISTQPVDTSANATVQKILETKITDAYKTSQSSNHWAHCTIPQSIGFLLSKRPDLVSHAVRTYYHRDPIEMRSCKKLTKFIDPCVLTSVRFTRTLYAQLLRQQLEFVPTGLPAVPKMDPEETQTELGYKLLCGFEILYKTNLAQKSRQKTNTKKNKQDEAAEDDDVVDMIDGFLESSEAKTFKPSTPQAPSSCDWLLVSPDEVNDLLATKHKEFEDFIQKKQEKVQKKTDQQTNPPTPTNQTPSQARPTGGASPAPTAGSAGVPPAKQQAAPQKSNPTAPKKKEENPLDGMASHMSEFLNSVSGLGGVDDYDPTVDKDINKKMGEFVNLVYGGKYNDQKKKDTRFRIDSESDDEEETSSGSEGDEFYEMPEEELREMEELMKMMDKELGGTAMGKSFPKKPRAEGQQDDEAEEIDVDLNLVQSFLKSFEEQQGMAGPVPTLLNMNNKK